MIEYLKAHGTVVFDGIAAIVGGSVNGFTAVLRAIPAPLLILPRRSWPGFCHRSLAFGRLLLPRPSFLS